MSSSTRASSGNPAINLRSSAPTGVSEAEDRLDGEQKSEWRREWCARYRLGASLNARDVAARGMTRLRFGAPTVIRRYTPKGAATRGDNPTHLCCGRGVFYEFVLITEITATD